MPTFASVDKKVFINEALTASKTSDAKSLDNRNRGFIGFIKATAVNVATTVDCVIQHSPNNTDWFDAVTFSSIVGAAGQEVVHPTINFLTYVRSVVTLAGAATAATVLVELHFGQN